MKINYNSVKTPLYTVFKIYSILLMLFFSSALNAFSSGSVSETRHFMKSFPANKDSRLEVKNRYGDVKISHWAKDSVYIMAEIEAFAPTESKLRKMLEGINTDLKETGSIIRAETEFDKSLAPLLETFKGLTEKIIEFDSRVKISYFINAPDYIDIQIDNQFGDITMENNTGTLSVSLSNGDFRANSLNKVSDLSINFGEAEIDYITSGKITTTFSKFVISECGDISVNSTSTRFDFKKAGRLTFESRRDKVFGGDVSELTGTSYFTDFSIKNLGKGIEFTLKYGSLDVDNTENRFENINIESAFSDITLAFGPSASYAFEIRNTNAFVVLPERNTRSEKEELNESKKEILLTGTFGSSPGNRRIKIEANRGNIYLK